MTTPEKFQWKIQNGDMGGLKEDVEKDGRIVNTQVKGRDPLHHAADYGQEDVIKFLLKNGAKINQKDKFGITPLLAAIYEEHVECVKLLLDAGADRTIEAPNGQSYMDCTECEKIKELLKK